MHASTCPRPFRQGHEQVVLRHETTSPILWHSLPSLRGRVFSVPRYFLDAWNWIDCATFGFALCALPLVQWVALSAAPQLLLALCSPVIHGPVASLRAVTAYANAIAQAIYTAGAAIAAALATADEGLRGEASDGVKRRVSSASSAELGAHVKLPEWLGASLLAAGSLLLWARLMQLASGCDLLCVDCRHLPVLGGVPTSTLPSTAWHDPNQQRPAPSALSGPACPARSQAAVMKSLGPFVRMVFLMVGDLKDFCFIFVVLWVGFASAFAVLFKDTSESCGFNSFSESLLTTFRLWVGDADFDSIMAEATPVAVLLYMVYMVLMSVVLLNILIAAMVPQPPATLPTIQAALSLWPPGFPPYAPFLATCRLHRRLWERRHRPPVKGAACC